MRPMAVLPVEVVTPRPRVLVLRVSLARRGRLRRVTVAPVAPVVLVVRVLLAVRLVSLVPGSMVANRVRLRVRAGPRPVTVVVWAVRAVPGLTPQA
jgi:hypothetical protein